MSSVLDGYWRASGEISLRHLVRSHQAARCLRGQIRLQNKYIKRSNLIFLLSTNFKLLTQIKLNALNDCLFLN